MQENSVINKVVIYGRREAVQKGKWGRGEEVLSYKTDHRILKGDIHTELGRNGEIYVSVGVPPPGSRLRFEPRQELQQQLRVG